MANGKDSKKFLSSNQVREGLKRDILLAFFAQSELPGSLSLTQSLSRKFQINEADNRLSENVSNKRLKSSNVVEEQRSDALETLTEEEAEKSLVKFQGTEVSNDDAVNREVVCALKPKSALSGSHNPIRRRKFQKIPTAKRFKNSHENEKEKNVVETPIKKLSKSKEETKSDPMEATTGKEPNHGFLESPFETLPAGFTVNSTRKEGNGIRTPIAVDKNSEFLFPLREEPLRRFSRSRLKRKVEPTNTMGSTSGRPVVSEGVNDIVFVKDGVNKAGGEPRNEMASKTGIFVVSDDTNGVVTVRDHGNKTDVEAGNELASAAGSLVVSQDENKLAIINYDGKKTNVETNNDTVETPVREETPNIMELVADTEKSLIKEGNDIGTPMIIDDSTEVHYSLPEKPFRRFTRSRLKQRMEPIATASGGSIVSKDASVAVPLATNLVSSQRTHLKKKLKMKMSKKIVLNKVPSTVMELLQTGMLEGLPVRYHQGGKKKYFQGKGLLGMVKDLGILCSCSICKGRKVPQSITPVQFQQHASCAKSDPWKSIFIENGKSIRAIVDACKCATLDTLEATIKRAIGPLDTLKETTLSIADSLHVEEWNLRGPLPTSCNEDFMVARDSCTKEKSHHSIVSSPIRETINCQNCKGSFPVSRTRRARFLCNSCIKTNGGNVSGTLPVKETANLQDCKGSLPGTSLCQNCRGTFPESRTRKEKQQCHSCKKIKTRSTTKRAIICQNCNGSILASGTSTAKQFCRSCLAWEESSANPSQTSGSNLRSSKSVSNAKASKSASKSILSENNSRGRITRKSSKSVAITKASGSASKSILSQNMSHGRITRKDSRLHKLVFEEDGLPEGTEVAYYARGQKLLEGYKKGFEIYCHCCNSEVSPSLFECHAGWASRRKPYQNIYTSNGVSLHELAISLSKGRKFCESDNDDLCTICAEAGKLLLCDGCPRAFHRDCLSLSRIPDGDWYCQYCQNLFQKEKFVECNANAVAAGRVAGVDPIEQISKRCIRIVKDPEAEVGRCSLCRLFQEQHSCSKSGFGPHTIILCDQCEKEYHVGCLKDHKMADLKELPEGNWFCCIDCESIHSNLQKLLVRVPESLPDSLLNSIKRKLEDKGLESGIDLDVRWRVLSGKFASHETRLLLSKAVAIFHDRFDPIVDSTTGRDLIPSMVYGRNLRGQEFGGMYCAVLTVNSSVISAGLFRIFGQEFVELPLVATRIDNQGQGYFQLLFSCIEKLLGFLNVRNIVLPATAEAESIWTDRFGFSRIIEDQLSMYVKDFPMLSFKGTSVLQKQVPKCRIFGQSTEDN